MELVFIAKILAVTFWAIIVGLLANRKNRNPWVWGVAGAVSWFVALIVLAFLPYKCPKCERSLSNDQGKDKVCPSCGSFAAPASNIKNVQLTQHIQPEREQLKSIASESLWSAALAEFEGEMRRPGLWARVFTEAAGNEAVAKAAYLKARVYELENEPPAFISNLRNQGYKVEIDGVRWSMVSPSGGSIRYFYSLEEFERKASDELNRHKKT